MDTWETGFREWADTTKILAGTSEIKCVEIDKVRFIFGTYWADGGATPQESALVEAFLRDFYVVRATEQIRWTVPRMAEAHRTQKKQLETFLEQPFEGKTVVISHHLPSYRLCHPRFGNDANGGFASNSDLILATEKVDCWIFGHTHDTIDHMMWKTRMVCNPAGYHREKDERYHKFAPKFINVSDIALPNHA